jgi:hypothetical protein
MTPIRWVNLINVGWIVLIVVLAGMGRLNSGDAELIAEGIVAWLGLIALYHLPRGGFRRRVRLVLSPEERRARRKSMKPFYAITAITILWEVCAIALVPKGALSYVALVPVAVAILLISWFARPSA